VSWDEIVFGCRINGLDRAEEKRIALFDESLNSAQMRTATGERPILLLFAADQAERRAIA
jgi:hypothetical protein